MGRDALTMAAILLVVDLAEGLLEA